MSSTNWYNGDGYGDYGEYYGGVMVTDDSQEVLQEDAEHTYEPYDSTAYEDHQVYAEDTQAYAPVEPANERVPSIGRRVSFGPLPDTKIPRPDVKVELQGVQVEDPNVEFKVRCGAQEGVGEVELEVSVAGLTMQIEQLLLAKADLMKELDRLSALDDEKDRELLRLQDLLEKLNTDARKGAKHETQLETDLVEAKRTVADLKAALKELHGALEDGDTQQAKLGKRLAGAQEENADLRAKADGLDAELREAEIRERQLKKKVRFAEDEAEELKGDLDARDKQIASLTRQTEKGAEEKAELKQRLKDAEAENEELREKLKGVKDKAQRLADENGTLLARQASLYDEAQALNDHNSGLKATVEALQGELSNYKAMLDNLSGGKSDLEHKLADLAREHQEKLRQMGLMARDLEETRNAVARLIRCNTGIATHVAARKATLLKETAAGQQQEWTVMGGPEGGANAKDPFIFALKKEVTRLEELERYEKGLTKLRDEEWEDKKRTDQKIWLREEDYYRKYIEMNEQEVFQVIFSMAHRERWSITKYILGKRALRDSVLGLDTSRSGTPHDLDRSTGSLSARDLPLEWSLFPPSPPPHGLQPNAPSSPAFALPPSSPARSPQQQQQQLSTPTRSTGPGMPLTVSAGRPQPPPRGPPPQGSEPQFGPGRGAAGIVPRPMDSPLPSPGTPEAGFRQAPKLQASPRVAPPPAGSVPDPRFLPVAPRAPHPMTPSGPVPQPGPASGAAPPPTPASGTALPDV